MAMRDIGSHAPRLKAMGRPKALGNRRSGRAGEPAAGESVGASESLDDVPHRPRLPSCPPIGPTDRLPDLYGSFSALLGIRFAGSGFEEPQSLSQFVDDGRIEIDTNAVERNMRPIALGRKNHLFAGSDGGARTRSIIASVIQSAKLNDVEPFACLRDILERRVKGHPINRNDELLAWNYASPLCRSRVIVNAPRPW